ncbi:MAG TPA: sulfatase [Myxococcota bacterium]|nr:sulfatase [Myxococcota bacterium]
MPSPARSVVLAAALALGAVSCVRETLHGARPDIILVSIDSLRPDHLGSYGYARDTSPTIDALGAAGARFTTATSTTSWTLPAHAALFTGLHDATHGLSSDGLRLAEEHLTLAEVLRGAGWRTAGFFGGPYLHPAFGLAQGFDFYQSCMTRLADDVPEGELRAQALGGAETAHADVTGPRLLEEAERWLATLDEAPFFLFLHLWDVHYDYIPPPGYAERFDPDYTGTLTGAGMLHDPALRAGMDPRDLAHLVALYDGEIRYTDEVLGKVLDGLDRRGRLANALVVVTADHGEEFFEHGGKGHRRTLFEEVVRVPLVVRWPGRVEAGRVVEDPVRLVDVMPTLLALAGVELPVAVQGRDLGPLLRGETLPEAPALLELRRPRRHLRALRTAERKLVSDARGRSLLFDLVRDPREAHPLRAREVVAEARRELDRTLEAALGFRDGLASRGAVGTPLDREMRERLEALGYLDASPGERASE